MGLPSTDIIKNHGLLIVLAIVRTMMRKQVPLLRRVCCKQYNHAHKRSLLHIWATSPSASVPSSSTPSPSTMENKAPYILLFGFAGSSPHHLAKQASVYSSLGYYSLSTIFPAQYPFSYDIHQITNCAHQVLEAAYKQKVQEVVVHSLSNNGAILYQHLTQLVMAEYQDITIKGAVFDSAPGPGNTLETLQYLGLLPKYPPTTAGNLLTYFLYTAYPWLNRINKMKLKDILAASVYQARNLEVNWRRHHGVPWPGPFLMNERADWPLLFLYSKKDRQIPWRYITRVADKQRSKGRKVTTHIFSSSGHVAHLKIHPEEYRHSLEIFMRDLS